MEIDKELYGRIREYCALNGMKIGRYINSLLKDAFLRDVYGELQGAPEYAKVTDRVPEIQETELFDTAAETDGETAPDGPEINIQGEKPRKRRRLN